MTQSVAENQQGPALRAVTADYCDSPDERAKNPEAKRHFVEIARGDQDALRFMWVFWNFSHVYDDLVDRDKPVGVEDAARWAVRLLEEFTFNPFFLRHKLALFPHVVGVFNRWCDGEQWEKSGTPSQVAAAHVVKCGDVDLYLNVAYLIGGWEHLRAMKDARGYDPIDRKA